MCTAVLAVGSALGAVPYVRGTNTKAPFGCLRMAIDPDGFSRPARVWDQKRSALGFD